MDVHACSFVRIAVQEPGRVNDGEVFALDQGGKLHLTLAELAAMLCQLQRAELDGVSVEHAASDKDVEVAVRICREVENAKYVHVHPDIKQEHVTLAETSAAHALADGGCSPFALQGQMLQGFEQSATELLNQGPVGLDGEVLASRQQQSVAAATANAIGAASAALLVFAFMLRMRLSAAAGQHLLRVDMVSQVLLLCGIGATFTNFHMDPAGAVTWAFALGDAVERGTLLAVWLFLHPRVLTEKALLLQLLKALKSVFDAWAMTPRAAGDHLRKFVTALDPTLSMADARSLAAVLQWLVQGGKEQPNIQLTPALMRTIASRMPENCVWVVEQFVGTAVRVPCGFMHYVWNVSACLKVAMEVLPAGSIVRCVDMQQQIRMYIDHGTKPYINACDEAVKALVNYCKWKRQQAGAAGSS
jgi:hypothetical protein